MALGADPDCKLLSNFELLPTLSLHILGVCFSLHYLPACIYFLTRCEFHNDGSLVSPPFLC